jgi:heat-inducible transcriptional repressor
MIHELNERTRLIFRMIVDSYLESGVPVGSRTLSKALQHLPMALSPASIRNVMADLEEAGLLYAPHTSAGRLPTEQGLRLYIDGLMQIGHLSDDERQQIETTCSLTNRPFTQVLEEAGSLLSGLSSCASLVIAPKTNGALKQIQFVVLRPRKIMAILVFQNGMVENRVLDFDIDVPEHALIGASNYLNQRLAGKTLVEAETELALDISSHRLQLDAITQSLIQKGLAVPAGAGQSESESRIIIRGQSNLLDDVKALEDLERARLLMGYLEKQQNMLKLLTSVEAADGVQIFIGTDNKIFDQSGWAMILAPYRGAADQIVGAIGVIGPTRLDYDRIIPMVDYTSRVVARLVEDM